MSNAIMNSDVVKITVNGKLYEFSQEMIKKYPKLLDQDTRYMIGFDSLLPIIYNYPPSTIREDLLDDNSEKQLFLKNCEKLEIKLSDDMILHLCSKFSKELNDCSEYIQEQTGRKGKTKIRFCNKKEVIEFCVESEGVFDSHHADIRPLEVIRLLELGTKKAIETLVLKDFRSLNCIQPFISKFLKNFLPKIL